MQIRDWTCGYGKIVIMITAERPKEFDSCIFG